MVNFWICSCRVKFSEYWLYIQPIKSQIFFKNTLLSVWGHAWVMRTEFRILKHDMLALSYMLHILHFLKITLVLSYIKAKLHSTRESRKRQKYNSYKKKISVKYSLMKRQSLLLLTLPLTPTKGLCICKTSMLLFMAKQEANSTLFLFPHSRESFPDILWEN